MQVWLATDAAHRALTEDDRILAAALAGNGVEVAAAVWSEMSLPPARSVDAVIVRSCWEYHLHAAAFARWLDELDAVGIPVLNPTPLIRWNLHKRYLLELAARGVAIVPTALVPQGAAPSLRALLAETGWREAVVKPAVSLGAYETWRVSADAVSAADEERFAASCDAGDVLLQAYVPAIESEGEWSLVFIGGAYSHAVRKRPRPGDFRVQTDFGGSVAAESPPAVLVADASKVLAALPMPPAYARVDGIDVGGHLVLMEAECIDPVLYFRFAPAAAERLAALVLDLR